MLALGHRLLAALQRFERPVLGAEILPPDDLPVAELEYAAHRDVHLDAAPLCAYVDLAPREHPLADIDQLVAEVEPVEDIRYSASPAA